LPSIQELSKTLTAFSWNFISPTAKISSRNMTSAYLQFMSNKFTLWLSPLWSKTHSSTTATRGNQLLDPRLVDGVKVFELTAKVVQWEVAPGELVEAYTYNGMVPGRCCG